MAREVLCALRGEITRLESEKSTVLAARAVKAGWGASVRRDDSLIKTAVADFDVALDGGLQRAALHEIRSEATRDNGAASGFALALARLTLAPQRSERRVLWIADPLGQLETGMPYAPGLSGFGLLPGQLVWAAPKHLKHALMLAEAAISVSAFAAVILEIYGNPSHFGLTESRRLHLRAKAFGRPLFLLRERGEEEASSATVRFRIRPAPAMSRPLYGSELYAAGIGNPVFRVALEKSRHPVSREFLMEWNANDSQFHEVHPERSILPGRSASLPERNAVLPRRGSADSGALLPIPFDRQDRAAEMGPIVALPRAS
jgi:protein ImuA